MTIAINKHNGGRMILAMSIAIFIPNFAQYQLSPLANTIMDEFNITHSQFSSLFTAPMIPAVALSVVAGVLLDRFDPKRVVGVSMAITLAGTVLSQFARSYSILFMAFMMIGVSAAVLNCGQAKLISGWYGPSRIPGRMGIILSASTLAMTLALATTALFPGRLAAFLVTSLGSALAFILWLGLYKSPPKTGKTSDSGSGGIMAGLKTVITHRWIWVIAICLFFIMAANVVMGSFTTVMLAARGIAPVQTGLYASIYMAGAFLSCYIAPAIVTKLKQTRPVVFILSVTGSAGVAFAVPFAPEGILLGAAILLTGICVGGTIPLLMAIPVSLPGVGPRYAGSAGGFVATIQLLGAIVGPSYVLIPLAGQSSFPRLFFLAGLCMMIAAAVAMLLPHRQAQPEGLEPVWPFSRH